MVPHSAHDESINHTADRLLNSGSHQHSDGRRRFTNRKTAIPFTSSYLMNNTRRPYLMSQSTGGHKLILFATPGLVCSASLFIKMESSPLMLSFEVTAPFG